MTKDEEILAALNQILDARRQLFVPENDSPELACSTF